MDCCAFQRLSKPWPKQNEWWKTRSVAPKHPHMVFFHKKKNLIQESKVYVPNQAKELDPYLYIIGVEILKNPMQSPCPQKCRSSSLYSCTCLSKKHMSMYQERVASPKTTCQAIFLSTTYSCLVIIKFSLKCSSFWQKKALQNNLLTRTSWASEPGPDTENAVTRCVIYIPKTPVSGIVLMISGSTHIMVITFEAQIGFC